MKVTLLASLAWFCVAGLSFGQTRSLEEQVFTTQVQAAGVPMDLKGMGLAKYLVFKVMVGGLYLPKGVRSTDVLTNVPKHFEVAYLREAPAADLVKLANKTLDKTLTKADREKFRAKSDQVNALFRDVVKGERCSVTFKPGTGISVGYNGKPVGTVAGDDFAAAYFTVWFGDRGCAPDMRRSIFRGF